MNIELLEKIRTQLKENGIDLADVAERIGVSRQCVSQHLKGKHKNSQIIIDTSLIMIDEKKAYVKKVSKKVNALIAN